MRGDHHDVADLQVQEFRSRPVDLRVRLVVPRQLRSEDAVPRQARELRKVRHQRDVPVRERRDDESGLQSRQAAYRIGPRAQPVPRVIEGADLVLGEPFHPEVNEDLVEDHPMQHIELGPWQLTGPHAIHARTIASTPGIGELLGVDLQPLLLRELRDLLRYRRPPVDDRAERVKDECLHSGELHFRTRRVLRHACSEHATRAILRPNHRRDTRPHEIPPRHRRHSASTAGAVISNTYCSVPRT